MAVNSYLSTINEICQNYNNLRWNSFWRFNAYSWIPFTRGQYSNTVEKFINACQEIIAVTSFVCNVMKYLQKNTAQLQQVLLTRLQTRLQI